MNCRTTQESVTQELSSWRAVSVEIDERIETALQCLLAAAQDLEQVLDGDLEAGCTMRSTLQSALASLYAIPLTITQR